jgi:hypothetical protein
MHKRILELDYRFVSKAEPLPALGATFQAMENRFSDTFPKRFAASLAINTDIRTEA